MIIWKHILKRVRKIIQYLLLLTISSLCVIVAFGLIYRIAGLENPLFASVNVFFDMNSEYSDSMTHLIVTQKTTKEIFIILFLGSVISQFIEKPNPIYFSKYALYLKKENKLRIRFWILLPLNQYLYNVSVKILVLDNNEVHKAENETKSVLNIRPKHESYNQIRGVWEFDITEDSPDKADEIIALLKKDSSLKFRIILNGTHENGRIFCGIKTYEYKDFIENAYFVSIRSTEFIGNENKNFFRYQNFDKVYVPEDEGPEYKKTFQLRKKYVNAQKDILTSEQKTAKQYCGEGFKTKVDDFFSFLFHFIYNSKE